MLHTATLTAFVATADAPRSKAFYQGTLGLHLVGEDAFALVFDANGIELRIQKLAELAPRAFTVLGWQVPDVRETVLALSGRGVSFERFDSLVQDDHGIWQAPGGASVAWFKDPDGNLLSVTQSATGGTVARE